MPSPAPCWPSSSTRPISACSATTAGVASRSGSRSGGGPESCAGLAFGCLAYDERADPAGGTVATPVLVHNMTKVGVVRCRLPIHQRTAALIREQQAAVRARFPDTPAGELVLFPAVQRPQGGRRPISAAQWARELQRWARRLELFEGWLDREGGLHLHRGPDRDPVRFDPARVFPYALRHSYAQRHVDAGHPRRGAQGAHGPRLPEHDERVLPHLGRTEAEGRQRP